MVDRLLEEADQLESTITTIVPGGEECITEASDRPEQSSRLSPALYALLPVLQKRVANLERARSVTQSGKMNFRLATKIRSMQGVV